MPLPTAGRQMQVEFCEIPLRGGSRNAFHLPIRQAILMNEAYMKVRRNKEKWGVASRRIRSDFLPRRRGGEVAGQRRRWAFFIGLFSVFQRSTDTAAPTPPIFREHPLLANRRRLLRGSFRLFAFRPYHGGRSNCFPARWRGSS
jgi:hypothetical protein